MVCGILLAEKKFTPNFFSCRANRSTLKKFQIFIIFLCVKFIPFRVLFFTRLELVLKGHFWTLGVVGVPPSQSLIKSWKNTPCLSVGDDSLEFYFRFSFQMSKFFQNVFWNCLLIFFPVGKQWPALLWNENIFSLAFFGELFAKKK